MDPMLALAAIIACRPADGYAGTSQAQSQLRKGALGCDRSSEEL